MHRVRMFVKFRVYVLNGQGSLPATVEAIAVACSIVLSRVYAMRQECLNVRHMRRQQVKRHSLLSDILGKAG